MIAHFSLGVAIQNWLWVVQLLNWRYDAGAMDKTESDAITKIVRWALSQMKTLETEVAALEATLENYPVIVEEELAAKRPFRLSEQLRFLQASVELARNEESVQKRIREKYDTFLARVHEQNVSLDDLKSALRDFETWKPSGWVN